MNHRWKFFLLTLFFAFGWVFMVHEGGAQAGDKSVQLEGNVLGYTNGNGATKLLLLPCAGSAVLEYDGLVFVACGEAGAVVLGSDENGDYAVKRQQKSEKSVDGFVVVDGALWARSGDDSAWPVDGALWEGLAPNVAAPVAPAPVVPAPVVPEVVVVEVKKPKVVPVSEEDNAVWIGPSAGNSGALNAPVNLEVEGKVIENRGGSVVVDRGRNHGMEKGNRLELFMAYPVSLGGEQNAVREESLAVGTVVVVTANHCEVELAVNEWVPEGAGARVTQAWPTDGIWGRPRIGDISEFSVMLRPYIGLERFAAGTVSYLDFNYRFEEPVRLRLIVDPLGFGFTDSGFLVSTAANLIASFDAELYEVGIGVGWMVINDDPGSFFEETTSDDNGELNSGLSLAQYARFGAEEGFNVTFYNSFVLFEKAFYYGGTTGTMQFPLGIHGRPMWIFFRGGGGVAGYAFGEVGLRILAVGNGGPDSIFVSPTVGYAGMGGNIEECQDYGGDNEFCYPSDDYFTGPMVGLGAQWRF
jgi:hypothetical protein